MERQRFYKFTKDEVRYTPRAKMKEERCALCKHFETPRGCAIVRGDIAPGGWCKKFERKG